MTETETAGAGDRSGGLAARAPSDGLLLLTLWGAAPFVAWAAHAWVGLSLQAMGWRNAFWVFALAPLVEEWVFRALLQRGLDLHVPGWIAAWRRAGAWHAQAAAHLSNVLVAAAFAAAHAPQHGWAALWWTLPALAVGEVWRRCHQLWPCVFLHAWFNLCLGAATALAVR